MRLVNLGITRKIVKPAIMNKPYNATQRTLVKYIKDLLYYARSDSVTIKNKDGELITFIRGLYGLSPDNLENQILINHKDIEVLVDLIMDIIYVKYPKIKQLNNYLRGMVSILNKLNLPVI